MPHNETESTEKIASTIMWSLFCVLAHVWWILFLASILFCEGAVGSGVSCSVSGLEDMVFFAELSTMFFGIPVFLPIVFWIAAYKSRQNINFKVLPVISIFLLLFLWFIL